MLIKIKRFLLTLAFVMVLGFAVLALGHYCFGGLNKIYMYYVPLLVISLVIVITANCDKIFKIEVAKEYIRSCFIIFGFAVFAFFLLTAILLNCGKLTLIANLYHLSCKPCIITSVIAFAVGLVAALIKPYEGIIKVEEKEEEEEEDEDE